MAKYEESEEYFLRLKSLVEVTDSAIIGMDLKGTIFSWNNGAEVLYGYSPAEVVGKSIFIILPPEHQNEFAETLERIRRPEKDKAYDTIRVKKDGTRIETSVIVSPITDKNGEIVGVSSIARDITERKHSEDMLRMSEEKYRLLVESASEAIVVMQDGKLLLANPMVSKITGYSEQELLSKPILQFIHPDDRAIVSEVILKRLGGESVPTRNIARMQCRDGSIKWVEISAVKIDWEGRPAGLAFMTDVTERKQAESELKKKTAEATESAQRAETYFDFLAHDIANILSPIMAYSDILKSESNSAAEVVKFSSKILEQVQRASSLIANLRKLESIEKTHLNEIDTIDLRTLFSSLDDNIRSDFPNKEIEISYDIPNVESMNVKGGDWVENILRCIYDNAVRYSIGSSVKLEIRASTVQQEGKGTYWQIEVSDHGPGIEDNIKNHFTDSLDTAKLREFKGVASSLPFCCSITKCLGGELLIDDRIPGDHKQGTRVIIRLPKGE